MSMEAMNGDRRLASNGGESKERPSTAYTNGGGVRLSVTGRGTEFGSGSASPYSFDTIKYIRDIQRKREEVIALRVLPKTHLLVQLVQQELAERELFILQERSLRQQIYHKRDEDRLKREEQRVQLRNRERLEEQRRRHAEELAAKKDAVVLFQRQIEAEVRGRLRLVCLLQPRLNVAAAVLAEIKSEAPTGGLNLLPELLEEERRVMKALKAEARHGKVEGGAIPHWARTCVAAAFNISAILTGAPLRATVEEVIKVPNVALRKVVVVRRCDGINNNNNNMKSNNNNNNNNNNEEEVVAWVHVRAGSDPLALAAEVAQLPAPEELPREASVGVVWPKEDFADITRKCKGNAGAGVAADVHAVVEVSRTVLSVDGVNTHEFTKKDIEAIGNIASA